jgi:hypothetical protein
MKEKSRQGFKVEKRKKKYEDGMKKNQFHFFCNLSFFFRPLTSRFQSDRNVHRRAVLDFFVG